MQEIHFYWWAEEQGYDFEEPINVVEKKLRNTRYGLAKILFGKKAELLRKYEVGKHDMD